MHWPVSWYQPEFATVRGDLLRGLYGGRPFSHQAGFYAPAFLPVSPDALSMMNGFLDSSFSSNNRLADEQLVMLLCRMQASVANHYRLCKPLARETYDVQTMSEALYASIRYELDTLSAEMTLMHQLFVTHSGWPEACWQAFQTWVAATAPMLIAMGYHEAIYHAAQVSRWAVLHASIQQPGNYWFALQAAILGWFHDPKLPISFSIDNLAAHPVVASLLAMELLQHNLMLTPLAEAYRACDKAPEQLAPSLSALTHDVAEALRINSDSRYVISQVVQPKLGIQLESAELRKEWDSWITARMNYRGNCDKLTPPSPELYQALMSVSLHTGLQGLDAKSWHEATAWWSSRFSQTASPSMLYQAILRGETSGGQRDVAGVMAEWLGQAKLMGESPFVHFRVPGALLLTHHEEVNSSQLAHCLAFADPVMLSPHKILMARPTNEPFYRRISSYLQSMWDNVADLTTPDGRQLADEWMTSVMDMLWQVARPNSTSEERLGYDNTLLLEADTWPAHIAYATEATPEEKALLQSIYEQIKRAYNQGEARFITTAMGDR
jgi:hypothetical protein